MIYLSMSPKPANCSGKCDRGVNRMAGREAGGVHISTGYRCVSVNRRSYRAHRIIWVMYYGEISEHLDIDHINGLKDDNRISNLRLTTHQKNHWNRTTAKGCSMDSGANSRPMWTARICVDGKNHIIGRYVTEGEAASAYVEAKNKYHCLYGPNMEIPCERILRSKGYFWNKQCKKWSARITVNKKTKHLGLFINEDDARAAYIKAYEELHEANERTNNTNK